MHVSTLGDPLYGNTELSECFIEYYLIIIKFWDHKTSACKNDTSHPNIDYFFTKFRSFPVWGTVHTFKQVLPNIRLTNFYSIQGRAVRIVDYRKLRVRIEPLRVKRDVVSLYVFYRLYNVECFEELFDIEPSSRF